LFPALSHLLGRWILPDEIATAVNFTYTGCYAGVLIAYPLSNWLCVNPGWQWAHIVPALASLPWSIVWALVSSDRPQTSTRISADELRLLQRVAPAMAQPEIDSLALLRSLIVNQANELYYFNHLQTQVVPTFCRRCRFVWVIALNVFAGNWVSYVFSMEIPQYLKDKGFGVGAAAGAISDLPPVCNMLFGLLAAWYADRCIGRGVYPVLTVRRAGNLVAIVPGSLLFIVVCHLPDSGDVGLWSRVGCLVVAAGLQAALNVGANAAIYDVAPSTAGTVCAFANSIGNIPGIAMPMLTAWMLGVPSLGWSGLWYTSACVGLAAALAFHLCSTGEVLERRWLLLGAGLSPAVSTSTAACGSAASSGPG